MEQKIADCFIIRYSFLAKTNQLTNHYINKSSHQQYDLDRNSCPNKKYRIF